MKKPPINKVPTTTKMNLACSKMCETATEAVSLFRALEWANSRGTTGPQFDEIENFFDRKEYPWK